MRTSILVGVAILGLVASDVRGDESKPRTGQLQWYELQCLLKEFDKDGKKVEKEFRFIIPEGRRFSFQTQGEIAVAEAAEAGKVATFAVQGIFADLKVQPAKNGKVTLAYSIGHTVDKKTTDGVMIGSQVSSKRILRLGELFSFRSQGGHLGENGTTQLFLKEERARGENYLLEIRVLAADEGKD